MQIKIISRIYDDGGVECRNGDTIQIQADDMDETGTAIIQEIHATYFTIIFDDRAVGYYEKKLRPENVISLVKHKD